MSTKAETNSNSRSTEQSQNIMTIAHMRYPGNVDNIPLGRANVPLGPAAGHGKWTPTDPAYNYLLSMPNVKPVVHMLADHSTELMNNYIVEIHTFPDIQRYMGTIRYKNTVRSSNERDANILLVLGPKPHDLPAQCSTGQTSATPGRSAPPGSIDTQ